MKQRSEMNQKNRSWFQNLKFIFIPSYWTMNYPFSLGWDIYLRSLMRDHKVIRRSRHTVYLGDQAVWIENYPYAFGTPYVDSKNEIEKIRPSRLTIYELKKKIEIDLIKKQPK